MRCSNYEFALNINTGESAETIIIRSVWINRISELPGLHCNCIVTALVWIITIEITLFDLKHCMFIECNQYRRFEEGLENSPILAVELWKLLQSTDLLKYVSWTVMPIRSTVIIILKQGRSICKYIYMFIFCWCYMSHFIKFGLALKFWLQ